MLKRNHKEYSTLIFCIILILVCFAFLFQYKLLNVQRSSTKKQGEEAYSREDIICILSEKIIYGQNNRYTDQEYQQIICEFQQRKESLDIIVDYLKNMRRVYIEFQATTYLGEKFHAILNTTKHLTIIDRRVSFLYTDISTYLQVCSNEKLVTAIEEISRDMDYAECRNGQITFTLSEEYFADKATIVYQYRESKNKDDYVYGISAAEDWTIYIYGYQEYVKNYPSRIFGLLNIPKQGLIRNWSLYTLESEVWKEADMGKKSIIIGSLILSLICFINALFVSRIVIPEKDEQIIEMNELSELYKTTEIPDLRYSAFMPYYMKQDQEFENVLQEFDKYKEHFEKIINLAKNMIDSNHIVSFCLLYGKWKENLNNLPGSDFLRSFEDYFFTFSAEKANGRIISMRPDKSLFQQVSSDEDLKSILNSIGKSGEVTEIIFCEETIWFSLTGPFFKEKVPVAVGYFHKGRGYYPEVTQKEWGNYFVEEYRKDMWLDEHWLIIVPYPACSDEDYNPYLGIYF